jgi:hypothetical protein
MNDFTLDELNSLYKCVRLTEMAHGECYDLDNIKSKLQSLLDDYDNDATEIISVRTGLALGDEYFKTHTGFGEEDFFRVIQSMMPECIKDITSPGIYEFELKVHKLK